MNYFHDLLTYLPDFCKMSQEEVWAVTFCYNRETLFHILNDLSELLHISVTFLDNTGSEVVSCTAKNDFCTLLQQDPAHAALCLRSDEELLNRCRESQRLETHICHAGLCDMAMPIVKEGQIAGYVLLGRMCSPLSPKQPLGTPTPELCRLYAQRPLLSEEQVDCLCDLLPRILFESAIETKKETPFQAAAPYIEAHLAESLSIQHLCAVLHVNKNLLYSSFKEEAACSVNAYITARRLEAAKELLLNPSRSVYAVAEAVGLMNSAYFCRLFKKHVGVSPTEYRRKL